MYIDREKEGDRQMCIRDRYNLLFGRAVMTEVATRAPLVTVGMTLAVIALSALGGFIGIKISKELKRSGAMKK